MSEVLKRSVRDPVKTRYKVEVLCNRSTTRRFTYPVKPSSRPSSVNELVAQPCKTVLQEEKDWTERE